VHWDHIQGLPFFEPAYVPDTVIDVYALLTAADELQQVIGGITRTSSSRSRSRRCRPTSSSTRSTRAWR
jgi:phosphoribosyl 1,2-cyclic phosphodiesterase